MDRIILLNKLTQWSNNHTQKNYKMVLEARVPVFQGMQHLIFHKPTQRSDKNENFSNLYYEASLLFLPKLFKDTVSRPFYLWI